MFDVPRCNALLAAIDEYRTVMTQYDDTAAMAAVETDAEARRRERFRGITASALPTRTAAATALLYGDRRRQSMASGSSGGGGVEGGPVTGVPSHVALEGLSVLPTRLHPILSRGGRLEEAVEDVRQSDELATRDARIAASLSRAPARAIADAYWEETIRLSRLIVCPTDEAAAAMPSAGFLANVTIEDESGAAMVTIGPEGITFGPTDIEGLWFDAEGVDMCEPAADGSSAALIGGADGGVGNKRASKRPSFRAALLPHTTAQSLSAAVRGVTAELKRFEDAIESLKERASRVAFGDDEDEVGAPDTNDQEESNPKNATRLPLLSRRYVPSAQFASAAEAQAARRARLDAELAAISLSLSRFAIDAGLETLRELHRTRIVSTYALVLEEAEAWLHSMATIHHAADRPLDPYEKTIVDDFMAEERLWASAAENSAAPTEVFAARTKTIADIRQAEQEHRLKKVKRLGDVDPGLIAHASEHNARSAATSRRFQLLQHVARQATRLRECATRRKGRDVGVSDDTHNVDDAVAHAAEDARYDALSVGQRSKAERVGSYVLSWVAEVMENSGPSATADGQSGGVWGSRSRPSQSLGISGGDLLLDASVSLGRSGAADAPSPLLSDGPPQQSVRSHRLSMSIQSRGFSRFVTTGAVAGVDLLSRVSTEELADQLARVLLALRETGVGADVIARRNELDACVDYIKTALASPALEAAVDADELRRILADLAEWREGRHEDSVTAADYARLAEVLRSSAAACGLSVLANYEAIVAEADRVAILGGDDEDGMNVNEGAALSPLEHAEAYERGAPLATRTPAAGVVPSPATDARAHAGRPQSSATLFRQFTADHQRRLAKRREAPIFDAISDCCDLVEAVQQLRVHVRIKGRSHIPSAFLTDRVEPLQRELAAVLEGLEGLGSGGGGVGSESVGSVSLMATTPAAAAPNLSLPPSPQASPFSTDAEFARTVGAPVLLRPSTAAGSASGGVVFAASDDKIGTAARAAEAEGDADANDKDAGIDASQSDADGEEKALAATNAGIEGLAKVAAAPSEAELIARLHAAADVAATLMREARDVHGVSVPASCFILTHAM